MRNRNQGFTLVGMLGIGAALSVIAVVGMQLSRQQALKAENAQQTNQTNRVVASVSESSGSESALQNSSEMQFAVTPSPSPSNPNYPSAWADTPFEQNIYEAPIDLDYTNEYPSYPLIGPNNLQNLDSRSN